MGDQQAPELWLNPERHCQGKVNAVPGPRRLMEPCTVSPAQVPHRIGYSVHASALPQSRAAAAAAFPLQTLLR